MDMRNRIRLAKIESEIGDTERKYLEELAFEKATNKTTLLMSNTYLKKLQQLQKRRDAINRIAKGYRELRASYDDVLKDRIKEVNKAEEDVKAALLLIINLEATVAIKRSVTYADDLKTYQNMLRSKKAILRNKQRALNNWMEKSPTEAPKRSDNMVSTYGRFKEKLKERTVADDKLFIENFKERQETISFGVLEKDPKWDVKPINNATIDLLTRPTENKGE